MDFVASWNLLDINTLLAIAAIILAVLFFLLGGRQIKKLRDWIDKRLGRTIDQHGEPAPPLVLGGAGSLPVLKKRKVGESARGISGYHYCYEKPDFVGRKKVIAELAAMANAPMPFTWSLLCGPGGTGKSRLALEACKRLSPLDGKLWQTGFLDLAKTPFAFWQVWQPEEPHFLVLDYVSDHFSLARGAEPGSEAQNHDFPAIMRVLAQRAAEDTLNAQVRFLLVEREYLQKGPDSAGDGKNLLPAEWYASLVHQTDLESLQVKDCLHNNAPLELAELTDDDLRVIGQEVLNDKAREEDKEAQALPTNFIDDLRKVDPKKRALFAIMLASYLADSPTDSPTKKTVLQYALQLEQRKSWEPAGFATEDYIALVRATVTGKPQSRKSWDDDSALRGNMINHGLGFLDEADNRFQLSPLEPDLVGEFFVLEGGGREADSSRRIHNETLENEIAACWKEAPAGTAVFFARCIQDFLTHPMLPGLLSYPPQEKEQQEYWAQAVMMMGGVYYDRASYDKALEWYGKALDIREKVLDPEHPDTAATYNNMALVYKRQGEYGKALEWYGKALGISEKILGTEHPSTATTYNNMAGVYDSKGEYDKALEWYGKALAITEKVLGMEHPSTAATYNNMAGVYLSKGEYDKALEWYEKDRAISEKVLGTEHPDTAATYNNMAGVYESKGEYYKALEWYVCAYRVVSAKLGQVHPHTQLVYRNLSKAYEDSGNKAVFGEWLEKKLSEKPPCSRN